MHNGLKVGRQTPRTLQEGGHASLQKQVESNLMHGHIHDRGIAHLPCFGARHGVEFRAHFETTFFVVAPPSLESTDGISAPRFIHDMSFVDEHTRDGTRS